ncbi:ABC transporter substrate-binding protein [Geodermatophilus marinus]|uniref:ABC transporter substrate-binding protein n=1 Tax=Geodermatophilus sp. LHW52908 TaxID=2303986 RepID=UPI000E3D4255|nr:ABC transporter substrate-binding protein [Geodermatophilus sp. LHW52908]RFU19112.1 ABC transporter substrate-binding protein [Geodermatophilus sp. LHW52908]
MGKAVRTRRRAGARAAGALALAAGLAACSSPADTGSSGAAGGGADACAGQELPESVRIMNIRALTGPVSFAGLNAQKGIDLALAEIEADGLLEGTTIELDTRDSSTSPQEAASFASQAIADDSYVAILGPEASAQSTAVSPIAQSSGIPVVYVQSGSEGVLTGDFTYRLTPPAESYFDIVGPWLAEQGIGTASVLFNTGNPTLAELGQTTVPAVAQEQGIEILSSGGVDLTAQDFTTPASQIAGENPDAAFLMLQGPQYPVAITQLRQAGFQGDIIGMSAAGAGNLAPAGQTAAGTLWPANYAATQDAESTQEFVTAFGEANDGETPNNYAAEAYDAMWFLARGLAEAGCADRAALQQGLEAVAEEGFAGAQGEITFEDNDARVPGVLIQWDGAQEVVVPTPGA